MPSPCQVKGDLLAHKVNVTAQWHCPIPRVKHREAESKAFPSRPWRWTCSWVSCGTLCSHQQVFLAMLPEQRLWPLRPKQPISSGPTCHQTKPPGWKEGAGSTAERCQLPEQHCQSRSFWRKYNDVLRRVTSSSPRHGRGGVTSTGGQEATSRFMRSLPWPPTPDTSFPIHSGWLARACPPGPRRPGALCRHPKHHVLCRHSTSSQSRKAQNRWETLELRGRANVDSSLKESLQNKGKIKYKNTAKSWGKSPPPSRMAATGKG